MKRNYSICFMILAALTATSCEVKEGYDYQAGNQIFFEIADSVTYSFAIKPSTLKEDILSLPVGTSGMTSAKEREVVVMVDPDQQSTAVEGIHYSVGKATIPAGEYTTNIPIKVISAPELATKEVYVYLCIVLGDEYLGDLGESRLKIKVKINNILTKPSNWDSFIKTYFGTYGPVKYQFIIDTLGLYEFMLSGTETPVTKAEMAYYKDKLKTELIKYEKEHGPLMEEGNIKVDFDI